MKMFAVIFACICIAGSKACTIVAVGKDAGGGSVYLAHTDDAGGGTQDVRLTRVPAADHLPGSFRAALPTHAAYPRIVSNDRGPSYEPVDELQPMSPPLGYVPQVAHTYAYWDTDYGVQNEKGLGIAESTCGSRTAGWPLGSEGGKNMWGIDELSRVALERCTTARCAIKTMGGFASAQGFYSADTGPVGAPLFDDTAECLGIADHETGEVWIFHVMTGPDNAGAVWAAQRLRDDHVTVVANGFTIRGLDLSDPDHFLASDNVISAAEEQGWRVDATPFATDAGSSIDNTATTPLLDFTATYAEPLDDSKGFPLVILYIGRRMWRVLSLFAPSLDLDMRYGWIPQTQTYPWSVKVEGKVDELRLFGVLRDSFEETSISLVNPDNKASWPFKSPIRYDIPKTQWAEFNGKGGFERAIAVYRTTFSFVLTMTPSKPMPVGACMWYGQDAPYGSVYVPVYGAQESVPSAWGFGHEAAYDDRSAYWAFNFLNNWAMLRFDLINADLRSAGDKLEMDALNEQAEAESHAMDLLNAGADEDKVRAALEEWSLKHMEKAFVTWKALAPKLIAKWHNGWQTNFEGDNDNHDYPAVATLGYDLNWLTTVGFTDWPGDTFAVYSLEGSTGFFASPLYASVFFLGLAFLLLGGLVHLFNKPPSTSLSPASSSVKTELVSLAPPAGNGAPSYQRVEI